tara:strand:+ start:449 stop:1651 length:1203 start_codon:yes stop_codon:yes gene_type:complete
MIFVKKILFFVESTFNKRDYERFGIEILKNRGFYVEIWDFTPLLRRNYFKKYTPPDYMDSDFILRIATKEEFLRNVTDLKGNEIVMNIIGGVNKSNYFIYEAFKRYKIHYGNLRFGPILKYDKQSIVRLRIAYFIANPFKTLHKIFGVTMRKRLIRGLEENEAYLPNYIMCGGKAAFNYAKHTAGNNTKLILVHELDYDLFLNENENSSKNIYGDYAVFLDQYNPFHPEQHGQGVAMTRTYCAPDLYYNEINKYFLQIEKSFGLEVIIASHPRANNNDYFEGRKVSRGDTIKLVKHSKLVLAHYSAATNFAILYNKPVIFITSSKFTIRHKLDTKRFAKELGSIPVDISNKNIKITQLPTINEEKYNLYKENYIKMKGLPEKNTWEIFADYCENLSSRNN